MSYPHIQRKALPIRTEDNERREVCEDVSDNSTKLKNLLPKIAASLKKRTKRSESPNLSRISDVVKRAQKQAREDDDAAILKELERLGEQQDVLLEEVGMYFKTFGLDAVQQDEITNLREMLVDLKTELTKAMRDHTGKP